MGKFTLISSSKFPKEKLWNGPGNIIGVRPSMEPKVTLDTSHVQIPQLCFVGVGLRYANW